MLDQFNDLSSIKAEVVIVLHKVSDELIAEIRDGIRSVALCELHSGSCLSIMAEDIDALTEEHYEFGEEDKVASVSKLEEFINVGSEDLVTELFVVDFGLLQAALGFHFE
jgi:hypothetical protein